MIVNQTNKFDSEIIASNLNLMIDFNFKVSSSVAFKRLCSKLTFGSDQLYFYVCYHISGEK